MHTHSIYTCSFLSLSNHLGKSPALKKLIQVGKKQTTELTEPKTETRVQDKLDGERWRLPKDEKIWTEFWRMNKSSQTGPRMGKARRDRVLVLRSISETRKTEWQELGGSQFQGWGRLCTQGACTGCQSPGPGMTTCRTLATAEYQRSPAHWLHVK